MRPHWGPSGPDGSTHVIYLDALGRPAATASLTATRGYTQRCWTRERGEYVEVVPTRWTATTLAEDCPWDGRSWDSYDAAVAEITATGEWTVAETGLDGHGLPWARLTHTETAAAAAAASEAARARINEVLAVGRESYLRYGDVPEDGRSRDHSSGQLLQGVSVWRGVVAPDGRAVIILDSHVQHAEWLSLLAHPRPAYEVSGSELDVRGPIGEPLLADASVVRTVSVVAAIVGTSCGAL